MKRSLLLASLTACAFGAPASAQNLLSNPSFEELIPPIIGFDFVDWSRFNNMFADENDFVPAFDGDQSVTSFGEFLGQGAQSDSGLQQSVVVANAEGSTFRASVWTRSPSSNFATGFDPNDMDGDGNRGLLPLLIMQFRDASGNVIGPQLETVAFDGNTDPADEWILRSVEGVAPAGTFDINVFLLFIQFDLSEGGVFWDLASLEIVEADACPADITMDGNLDFFDVQEFLALFAMNDPAADFTGDGSFDFFDVQEFLDAFASGCP